MFPLRAVVATVSAHVWLILAVFLPGGTMRCIVDNARRTLWVWGPAFIMALLFGFATVAHVRWRLMFMPFCLIIVAQGIVSRARDRTILYLTGTSMGAALSLYAVVKYLR
jgi:hypothetical protein